MYLDSEGKRTKRDGKKEKKRNIITGLGPAVYGTAGFRFVSQKCPICHYIDWVGSVIGFQEPSGVHEVRDRIWPWGDISGGMSMFQKKKTVAPLTSQDSLVRLFRVEDREEEDYLGKSGLKPWLQLCTGQESLGKGLLTAAHWLSTVIMQLTFREDLSKPCASECFQHIMEHVVLCIQVKIAGYIWLEMDSDMTVEDDLWNPKKS